MLTLVRMRHSIHLFSRLGKISDVAARYKSLPYSNNTLFFAPGLLLVVVGLFALAAPQLFVAIVASALVMTGVVFSLIAWKIVHLKSKLERALKDLEGKVFVHAAKQARPEETQILESHVVGDGIRISTKLLEKKFLLH